MDRIIIYPCKSFILLKKVENHSCSKPVKRTIYATFLFLSYFKYYYRLGLRMQAQVDLYRPSPYEIKSRRVEGLIVLTFDRAPSRAKRRPPIGSGPRYLHGRFHTFTFSSANAKSSRTCSSASNPHTHTFCREKGRRLGTWKIMLLIDILESF